MAFRLTRGPTQTPPSPPDPPDRERHVLMVAMLDVLRADWSSERLGELIDGRAPVDEVAARVASYIVDKPKLWIVSDDDFIAAARVVDPTVAEQLAAPAGIDFLHRMSRSIALKGAALKVKAIFG